MKQMYTRAISLALGQTHGCPSASEVTFKVIGCRNPQGQYDNHSKIDKNEYLCIFYGIYCILGNLVFGPLPPEEKQYVMVDR